MDEETINNIIEEIEDGGNVEFSEEYKESWNELLKNRSFFPDICKIFSKITNILPQISLVNLMNDAFAAESRLLSFQQLNLCICFLIDFINNNGSSLENNELKDPLISLMTVLYRFMLETEKLTNIHINILKTMRDPVLIPQKKMILLLLKSIVKDVRDNDNFMTNIGFEKFKKDFKQK